ncbi:putative baseplate assembly protein [Bradyrhizobium symbiodeficiens]|uniref:Baseplate assembly protein n=1 Tax=Bradyrhizobium symbiodeficiens TaxID=1404367 RepID=A0ABX5W5J6_9BRAD|nr:putative baseplate assembly protein [Bradyrhizobium symbiodeficiens]
MDLRLKLDDTDFDTLAEAARAMIPALAPEWTDHNIHDPGIMLTELMAWVAEAQIYGLSRTRRDERTAYARLLGIGPQGPRPAQGLIWPLEEDERTGPPVLGVSIARGAAVRADLPELPVFRTCRDQHLSPAILRSVRTISSDGSTVDNTRVNRRNGATYLPFGSWPDPDDRLVLSFEKRAIAPGGTGAFGLGVEVSDPDIGETDDSWTNPASIDVSFRDDSGERPVRLLDDTTQDFTRSGVLLLDIAAGEQFAEHEDRAWFELVLRPRRRGFLRLPRVRRIAANVLLVEQLESVVEEVPQFGQAKPGQAYMLGRVGRTDKPALSVAVDGQDWGCVGDLSTADPDHPKFEFDPASGRLQFGNGVNGRLVPINAPLKVGYDISTGTLGNLPAGIGWSVAGVGGLFGRNSQAFAGGADATQFDDLQAQARHHLAVRVTHVTPGDLEEAAKALGGLRVVRAHELLAPPCDVAGARTLLVMTDAQPGLNAGQSPESPLWLEAVRSRLAPHLLAGERLTVVAPRYVGLGIAATLQISAAADPAEVEKAARDLLASKFTDETTGRAIWRLGRDVTTLMVSGWLRKMSGVKAVGGVTLRRDGEAQPTLVSLGSTELPRLRPEDMDISVERLTRGGSR